VPKLRLAWRIAISPVETEEERSNQNERRSPEIQWTTKAAIMNCWKIVPRIRRPSPRFEAGRRPPRANGGSLFVRPPTVVPGFPQAPAGNQDSEQCTWFDMYPGRAANIFNRSRWTTAVSWALVRSQVGPRGDFRRWPARLSITSLPRRDSASAVSVAIDPEELLTEQNTHWSCWD
jgi:hypothetical protein